MPGIPESLNAVTLVTHDMAASVAFYETLGMTLAFGGADAPLLHAPRRADRAS